MQEARSQQCRDSRYRGARPRQRQRGQRVADHRRPVQRNAGGEIDRQAGVVLPQAIELASQQVFQRGAIGGHLAQDNTQRGGGIPAAGCGGPVSHRLQLGPLVGKAVDPSLSGLACRADLAQLPGQRRGGGPVQRRNVIELDQRHFCPRQRMGTGQQLDNTIQRGHLPRLLQALLEQVQPTQEGAAVLVEVEVLAHAPRPGIDLPAQQCLAGLARDFGCRRRAQQVVAIGRLFLLRYHLLPEFQRLGAIDLQRRANQACRDRVIPLLLQPAFQRLHRCGFPDGRATGGAYGIPFRLDPPGEAVIGGEEHKPVLDQRHQRPDVI